MSTDLKTIDKQAKVTITSLFKQMHNVAVPLEHLNVILSTPPPEKWVKVHPYIKTHKYLPIDKVEYLLRSCFKKFAIEVKEVKQLFNAVNVSVRVHYLNPATNEMMFHDGVGSWDLQTKSGSGALQLDLSNINIGAVPMATGIAKSVAIKDACDHFGTLFGANLNRKDVANFEGNKDLLSYDAINDKKESDRVLKFIDGCTDVKHLETVKTTAITLGLEKQYLAKEVQLNG